MIIRNILAREILDSRGNPTIEVELTLNNNIIAIASVPSGASTGSNEALELRDNDSSRYHGKGVLKAVNNVNTIIRDNLLNKKNLTQLELDNLLIKLDGTFNKNKLGANAILGVSLAYLKACAKYNGKELYNYVGTGKEIPKPMMNILNGGMHADNNLDIQEFMIVPNGKNIKENVMIGSEVFHTLKKILKENGYSTNVGDEGGFAPTLSNNEEALDLIVDAITKSSYEPGEDVFIALDVAASSFYDAKDRKYILNKKKLSTEEIINYYEKLIKKYPIISIEDPLDENDWDGFSRLTEKLGNKIQIVGDDLFTTNKDLLQKGIDKKACNAILIKANQIGTITETIYTISLAKRNNYNCVISHRSGETEDTFIADLAVALNINQIKTGSICRGERIAKYNRLIRIYDQLNN